MLFIDVTCAVHATIWLSLLDGKQPTVFDNDIDTGTKPTEDVLFHLFKYFFHLMIVVCEQCNDQKICLFFCLFYYRIYYGSLPNFIFKKKQIW